jgi:hypothetical protein
VGAGSRRPLIVVVASGDPGVPVTCCARTGGTEAPPTRDAASSNEDLILGMSASP